MDFGGDDIRPERLYELVERILAKEIADGQYDDAGYLPSERNLMTRFNVGRPAIRDALFSLERRGLVERSRGRRVRPLKPGFETVIQQLDLVVASSLRTRGNLRHLMELRRFIESSLAEKAAHTATTGEIEKLRVILGEARSSIHDQERFWLADIAFHEALAEISRNPILPEIVKAVARWLIGERRITMPNEERNRKVCNQHEAIIEAIEKGDGRAASRAMTLHFEDTEQVLGLIAGLGVPSQEEVSHLMPL